MSIERFNVPAGPIEPSLRRMFLYQIALFLNEMEYWERAEEAGDLVTEFNRWREAFVGPAQNGMTFGLFRETQLDNTLGRLSTLCRAAEHLGITIH